MTQAIERIVTASNNERILEYLEKAIAHIENTLEILKKIDSVQKAEPTIPSQPKVVPERHVKRVSCYNRKLKLTAEEIATIKYQKDSSPEVNEKLAKEFGTTSHAISQIQSGKFQPDAPQVAEWILESARNR
jgi:endo-alpha-1,4-polygalactosaminidase (GH114 family)